MWYVGFYHEVENGREIVSSRFQVRDADWEKMPDTTDVRTTKSQSVATRWFHKLPAIGADVTGTVPRVFQRAMLDAIFGYGVTKTAGVD